MTPLLAAVAVLALGEPRTVTVVLVGEDMDPFATALVERFADEPIDIDIEHSGEFAPEHGPPLPGTVAEAWIIATPNAPLRIVVTDQSRGPAFTREVDVEDGVGPVEVEEVTLIVYEAVASLRGTSTPPVEPIADTPAPRRPPHRFGYGGVAGGAVGVAGREFFDRGWQPLPFAFAEGGYLFAGPAYARWRTLRLSITGAVEYIHDARPSRADYAGGVLFVPRIRIGGAGRHVWGFGTLGMQFGAWIERWDGSTHADPETIEPRLGGGIAVHGTDHLLIGAEVETTIFPFFGPYVGGQVTFRWVQRR